MSLTAPVQQQERSKEPTKVYAIPRVLLIALGVSDWRLGIGACGQPSTPLVSVYLATSVHASPCQARVMPLPTQYALYSNPSCPIAIALSNGQEIRTQPERFVQVLENWT